MEINIHHHFHVSGECNPLAQILTILSRIETKENQIMATLAEFQTKIDTINANTTASATAAQKLAEALVALRAKLDQVLTDAGVSATDENAILGQLDSMASTSAALKTFLEATAAGPGPEPAPVQP